MKKFFNSLSVFVAVALGAITILALCGFLCFGVTYLLDSFSNKSTWTYNEAVQDTKENPMSYRMLRIECTYKGETRLILFQRYFHVVSTLKSEEPAFDKCVIEEIQEKK